MITDGYTRKSAVKMILAMLMFFSAIVLAQNTSVTPFSHIQPEKIKYPKNLSQNQVNCILQDHKGYLWIGTKDGLNRYDGYQFVVYGHDPFDETSISNNFITTIYEDSQQRLWIGTRKGLNFLDRSKNIFYQIPLENADENSLSQQNIRDIAEDQNGNILVATWGSGLIILTPLQDQQTLVIDKISIKKIQHIHGSSNSLSNNLVRQVIVDNSGSIWATTSVSLGSALHKINFDQQYKNYQILRVGSKEFGSEWGRALESGTEILRIANGKNGNLWFGAGPGLVHYNPHTGASDFYNLSQHGLIPPGENWGWVQTIFEDNNNNVLFGTFGGWATFNPQSGKYVSKQNYINLTPKIHRYGISAFLQDKGNIIWMGTNGDGLYKLDPKSKRFSTKRLNDSRLTLWKGASIRSICESRSGLLWVGTVASGLIRIDRHTGESSQLTKLNNQYSSTAEVYSLVEDTSGVLWASSLDGVFQINKPESENPEVTFFPIDPTVPTRDKNNIVYKLLVDRNNNIWVATPTQFGQFNHSTASYDLITFIEPKSGNSSNSEFPTIYEDVSGNIWLGSIDGLRKFDSESKTFKEYHFSSKKSSGLSHSVVRSIISDPGQPEKFLWIGTAGGGLNRLDLETDTFHYFTQKDGLPDNVVYGILSDNNKNLWISTNNGISRFTPETLSFKNFDVNDGLQNNEFNAGAFFKSISGELFFGGIEGLNAFYPDKIHNNDHSPSITITDFRVSNNSIYSNGPDFPHISNTKENKEVKLSYNDKVINIEFAAMDFTNPSKNHFSYIMDNFDNDWQDAGTNRHVTYTNLDHGEYTFRVKGTNNDGLWSEKEASIRIIITPPWWRAYWAYAIYAVLIIVLLLSLRSYEVNRQRLKYNLQIEKIEREKLRELDHLKSRFFTNVSHEFRTPLTLILGQIKNVVSKIDNKKDKNRLNIAHRNASKLLHLINQLMDISRLESGKMTLNLVYNDVLPFLKNLLFSFESLAEQKQLSLHFHSDTDILEMNYDMEKLEKIILNLLSNAFKFTPSGGSITLIVESPNSQVSIAEETNYVAIHLKDTGVGIPENLQKFIFDRFYQIENPILGENIGSGIGLAFVKELVELLHGKIKFMSTEGDGTTFSLYLPAGKDFYSARGIQSKTNDTSVGKARYQDELLMDKYEMIPDISATNNQTTPGMITTATELPIILVVEDNGDVRSFICEHLRDNGYTVLESPDGEDGLAKAGEIIPDLIITDVMMPKVDGYEFSKQIRADQKTSHIPLIMLTAKASEDSKIEGLEAGVDDYLVKPFSARELQVRVRNLIQLRKQLRARFSNAAIIEPSEVSDLPLDQVFLRKVIDTIKSRMGDETFGVEDLASNTGMSVTHLNRKLRALLDQSPGQFIRSQRLQRAAELLLQNAGNVAEIAYRVGFSDQAHFTRSFKKQFGCPPTKYNG